MAEKLKAFVADLADAIADEDGEQLAAWRRPAPLLPPPPQPPDLEWICSQTLEEPWPEVVMAYFRVGWALDESLFAAAYETQVKLAQYPLLSRWPGGGGGGDERTSALPRFPVPRVPLRVDRAQPFCLDVAPSHHHYFRRSFYRFFQVSSRWVLPVGYLVCSELRQLAVWADAQLEAAGEKTGKLEDAARVISKAFSICTTDRCAGRHRGFVPASTVTPPLLPHPIPAAARNPRAADVEKFCVAHQIRVSNARLRFAFRRQTGLRCPNPENGGRTFLLTCYSRYTSRYVPQAPRSRSRGLMESGRERRGNGDQPGPFSDHYQVKRQNLCRNVLRSLKVTVLPELSEYPVTQQATFHYYQGVLFFLKEDYANVRISGGPLSVFFYFWNVPAAARCFPRPDIRTGR
ncbi:MAG: hypothetical protein BJ554DRAFT_2603 [Olpidium bornovanus]|uniref:Uncharacterized protein n=1 Tax=Olpidium bornovanus TaxID=278681 RepID=A0A8H7ZQP3_9FUNG|nr:MAG: hypothetical protein BJ554DRAFT_2603 [Olpidium bornovanus]